MSVAYERTVPHPAADQLDQPNTAINNNPPLELTIETVESGGTRAIELVDISGDGIPDLGVHIDDESLILRADKEGATIGGWHDTLDGDP